jgi:hypothetical protein
MAAKSEMWHINSKWFHAMYGFNPIVYAQIIEELQTAHIEKACV